MQGQLPEKNIHPPTKMALFFIMFNDCRMSGVGAGLGGTRADATAPQNAPEK